ncbi:cell division protein ZapE [Vitreoscilla stercoraria]|nr:AFG1-like ATPase [Vitreoscilla sp. C1]
MTQTMNTFTPPSFQGERPKTWYAEAKQQKGFIADNAQEMAIAHLDQLWGELMAFKQKRNRFLGRSIRSPQSPNGLYLWGGVGRGKSFLMDAFFGCLPYRRKRRVHFHAFMAEMHARLGKYKSEENPVDIVAAELAREVRVLCFDEFHVSDIADAMILGRLLEGLFNRGVVMVATSNYEPKNLYFQGQNRSSFLPTIALIENHLQVINVDGGEDHRLRTLTQAPIFLVPNDSQHEAKLSELFEKMTQGQTRLENTISIWDRPLKAKAHTSKAIWFEFETLCFGPRSQADYLYLAQNYEMVFVSNMTALTPLQRNEARRLTWLVDVFYDYRVKMCATSEVEAGEIYIEGSFAEEFTRTVSRMVEMQSHNYLSLPHLSLGNNKS